MPDNKNPFLNASGCPDPTAYHALKPIIREEEALDGKVNFLIKVLKYIIAESGFELLARIELRDKKTGEVFSMRDAIAIDFDGCLCVNKFPDIGAPNWAVIAKAKERQSAGAGLILWTCREGLLLRAAVQACREWGLTFDAINESLPDWIEAYGTRPRKVGATEYWDDRAVLAPVPNEPLTLAELLEMEGEPVWVEHYNGGEWITIHWDYSHSITTSYQACLDEDDYGDDWLAYRHKL